MIEQRFAARADAMNEVDGFLSFELLRPTAGEDRYFVYTRWETEEAFQAWRESQRFAESHAGQTGPAPRATVARRPRRGEARPRRHGRRPPRVRGRPGGHQALGRQGGPMAQSHPARHLLRAHDLADTRYAEPLTVGDLAGVAGLSPAHFSREFAGRSVSRPTATC